MIDNQIITPPYAQESQVSLHFYWLDLIRFLAAFLVLLSHFRGAFLPEYSNLTPTQQNNPLFFSFYFLTRLGNEAVMIFFVLSGFLVGGRVIERCKNRTFDLVRYSVDRSVRIMLPLISALLFSMIVRGICGETINIPQVIGNLFSLQGVVCNPEIAVLWSLSYEVWFYIIAAAFAIRLFATTTKQRVWSYVTLGICFLVFVQLSAHYLFIWLAGAVIYCYLPKTLSRIKIFLSLMTSLLIIPLMQLSSASNIGFSIQTILGNQTHQLVEVLFGILFAVFVSLVIIWEPRHGWSRWINKNGTRLAAFSYTLYLVHYPIMDLLKHYGAVRSDNFTMASFGLFIIYILVGIVGSYLIYLLFERNTGAFKRYIFALISHNTRQSTR